MSFEITDEHVAFAEASHGALERLMEGLSPNRATMLMDAVARVSAASQERYGIAPTANEIVSLPGVKSAVLAEGVTLDLDSALFDLESKSARVAAAVADHATDPADDPADATKGMSPQQRINWARRHTGGR